MQAYIEDLSIKGFKSFSKPVKIKFEPGFCVIVGPNGSGKSNILDSLCFTLGRLSTKSLRADNYSELISRNIDKKNKESKVSITLVNDGSFPIDSKKLHISRRILPSGQTKYKLNNKTTTRGEILEILSRARIMPEGHNIILQGDVNRFVDMTSIERRKLVEEIAGIVVYENRKDKTLKELEKVNQSLKDAQIVLREKETYMKNLESEKSEAEKYKGTIDELKRNRFTLSKLKLSSKEKEEEKIEESVSSKEKEIENLNKELQSEEKNIENMRKELDVLEDKIEELGGGERLALQKEIENLKVNIENSKNLEENSKRELERIENRKKQLKDNFENINNKIKNKKNNISKLEELKDKLLGEESSFKKDSGEDKLSRLNTDIENIQNEIQNFQEDKLKLREKIQSLETDIDKKEYRIEDIDEKLNKKSEKSSNISSEKKRYKELVQNIGRLVHEDSKLAVKIGEIRKEIIKIEDELAKIRVEDKSREQFVLRSRAIKSILEAKNSKKIKGIHGTVMDLGTVDKEYSTALEVCAGSRVKNIVVDNSDVAIECLNLLKRTKSGIATFLPLSKIKAKSSISPPKDEGVIGLASSLIKCDSKYLPIFKYILGNTLIVRDIETAKRAGIGKYRMVTLKGDVFNISGAIQGGYRTKIKGLGFKTDDLSGKINEVAGKLEQLKNDRNDAEDEREEIEKKLENLRKEKASLEGKLESYDEDSTSDLENEREELKNKVSLIKNEREEFNKKIKDLEKEIEKKNSDLNEKKNNLSNIKSKESQDKLKGVQEKRINTESELAQLKSVLENTLLPEKENINRVLKQLKKEKESFEEQIKSEKSKREKLSAKLSEKEKQEGSFYSKLKATFKKKNEINSKIKDSEIKVGKISKEISNKKDYKNRIVIKKAKIKAEVEGIQEELKEFNNVEEIKGVSLSTVNKKVIELKDKVGGFGEVNLKALEKWKELKKEFDNLTWKIGKLDSEKQDIEKIINKIESKKKEVFLNTFQEVNKNFERIFNKISPFEGVLELEKKRDPFEGGIRINITDNNKRKKKRIPIASLSGGEKVLTALALIFSIQELDPAPFYLMDEIDAALDKVNSEKVAKLLKEYSKKAQVIMISHNDSIISEGDQLYGVSMNKKTGISSVISLKV